VYDHALEYFKRHRSRVVTIRLLGVVPRVIRVADPKCVVYFLLNSSSFFVLVLVLLPALPHHVPFSLFFYYSSSTPSSSLLLLLFFFKRCVEYILKDNFQNYEKGSHLTDILLPLLGDGIFNVNGTLLSRHYLLLTFLLLTSFFVSLPSLLFLLLTSLPGLQWKQQRQTASHLFSVKELRQMVDTFSKHALELADLLLQKGKEGKEVDTQDLFSRATLDSIGVVCSFPHSSFLIFLPCDPFLLRPSSQIAFGENIDSLHKEEVPFATAFNKAQLSIDDRVFFPLWKFMPFLPSERNLRASLLVLDSFAFGLVDARKRDPNVAEKKDLLSRYVMMRDEQENPFSDTYLRDMVLNVSRLLLFLSFSSFSSLFLSFFGLPSFLFFLSFFL
jgi:hypothetical protein